MSRPVFLRQVLYADGLGSAACAALLVAAAGPAAELTGLPRVLVLEAGLLLVPFALLVLAVASRAELPRVWVKAIIGINIAWAAASLALLATPWIAPTALGYAFVIVQALAVAGFAELQILGLKRAAAPA